MQIAYDWLQEYIEDGLPPAETLADMLTMHAYEVEEVITENDGKILDIDVLPNRAADSLSHLGVAREVATLLDTDVNASLEKPDATADTSSDEQITLDITSDHVRRATKRFVTDVTVTDSPEWLQKRLKQLGISPINNIVDITNYVMLAVGQPVHAFDYDKLAGDIPKDVVIREAKDGETITTLDENEYELQEGMLVIADNEKPLDIAGIKGGLNSHIDEDTERVMLSVCSFDPAKIRQTSQALNLRTDASKRFENNISPETVRPALDYLSALIEDLADGAVTEDVCEQYPQQSNQYVTGVSVEKVNDLLGTDISQGKAKEVLERCHCEVDVVDPIKQVLDHARDYEGCEYERGASVSFDAPHKFDCSGFISYLFSHYGGVSIPRISVDQYVYGESVPEADMQAGDVVFANTGKGTIYTETQEFMPETPVEEGVDHCGLYLGGGQIIHATKKAGKIIVESLDESSRFSNVVGIRRMATGERLRVRVPYWRQDLHQPEDLVEEIGRVHGYEGVKKTVPEAASHKPEVHKTFYYTQKIRDILTDLGLSEVYTYAFQEDGEIKLENPIADDKKYLRESLQPGLRQALEVNKKHKALLDGQEITIFEIGHVFQEDQETLQLGFATTGDVDRVEEVVVDMCDQLFVDTPDTKRAEGDADILTCDLKALIEPLDQPTDYDDLRDVDTDIAYQPFSKFPYVLRDIALWVPQEVESRTRKVESTIQEAAGDLLVNIKLFDEYNPDDQDRVSLAYRLVFQSDERTLQDEEVNELMDCVYEAVEEKGWEVR